MANKSIHVFYVGISAMAARNIASLLHTLTSEEYVRSESSDNDGLETLITEYFTGNDD